MSKLANKIITGCLLLFIFNPVSYAIDMDLKKNNQQPSQISNNSPAENTSLNSQYVFTKDTLEFRTKICAENLKYVNGSQNSNIKLLSSGSQEARLNWYMNSGLRWQPMVSILAKTVNYKLGPASGITYKSDHLLGMGIGIRYRSSRRFIFRLLAEIEQYHFLDYTDIEGAHTKQLIEASPTKFTFLTDLLIYQNGRLILKSDFGPVINLRKKTATVTTNSGIGVSAELLSIIILTKNDGLIFGGQFRYHKQLIKNGYFQADTLRVTTGLFLQYNHTF